LRGLDGGLDLGLLNLTVANLSPDSGKSIGLHDYLRLTWTSWVSDQPLITEDGLLDRVVFQRSEFGGVEEQRNKLVEHAGQLGESDSSWIDGEGHPRAVGDSG
jgi:hypothetical protein